MNTVIVKKFEILRELPNCDAGTTKQVDAIGKMVIVDLLDAKLSQCKVVTTIQFVKNAVSAKHNKARCNKVGLY